MGKGRPPVAMSGGLLQLIQTGANNTLTNGNPSVTFFSKAYARYTPFSLETQSVALSGPQTLTLDAPVTLRAKVQRAGDLLTDVVFVANLPDMWSRLDVSGTVLTRPPRSFAWVRQVGLRLLQSVRLLIGAVEVQSFPADWLMARAALDLPSDAFDRWSALVGDVPELYAPAGGAFADPSGGYPSAAVPSGGNAPSIRGRTVRVPLGLWLSEAPSLALPLIAVQGADVVVEVTLRPLRELYTVLDAGGARLRWGVALGAASDASGNPLPPSLNTAYTAANDPLSAPRYFLVDAPGVAPTDGWELRAHLEATFAFLAPAERYRFAGLDAASAGAYAASQAAASGSAPRDAAAAGASVRAALSALPPAPIPRPPAGASNAYLVRQVRTLQVPGLNGGSTSIDIEFSGLCSRLVWFVRRSDAVPYRNDFTNLTAWKDATAPPFARPGPSSGAPSGVPCSGVASLPGVPAATLLSARGPVLNATITSSGNPLFSARDGPFFADYVPWRTGASGGGGAVALHGALVGTAPYPLYAVSFALAPASPTQPSGTWNLSVAKNVQLVLTLAAPPVTPPSGGVAITWDVTIFVETLNELTTAGGVSGLTWST